MILFLKKTSFKEGNGYEFGDFDVLTALRGWIPEKISLNHGSTKPIADLFSQFLSKRGSKAPGIHRILSSGNVLGLPGRVGTIGLTAPTLPKTMAGAYIFLFRDFKEFQGRNINLASLPIPYRVIDVQYRASTSAALLIRPYFSTG